MVEKTADCPFTIQECSRLKSYGVRISMGSTSLPEEYRICERVLAECQIREYISTHLDAVNDVRREIERDSLEPKQTASFE